MYHNIIIARARHFFSTGIIWREKDGALNPLHKTERRRLINVAKTGMVFVVTLQNRLVVVNHRVVQTIKQLEGIQRLLHKQLERKLVNIYAKGIGNSHNRPIVTAKFSTI